MHAAFVLPPGTSAGGAYVRSLSAAMRTAGHRAEVIEVADPVAAVAGLPQDIVPIIDGLALPAFVASIPSDAVALVHHPGAADAGKEREALARFGRVVASSRSAAKRLAEEFGVMPERVAVVEPGVGDLPRSEPAAEGCRILSVGAITARKGHDALLRALARLHDLEWTLTIAGDARRDPAFPSGLLAQAEAAGILSRVTLLPDPDDAALEREWRAAHLFALATRWEGYPAAVAQALRRGLPVAATTEAAGLVPQGSGVSAGVLAPVDDDANLSKGLRRMVFDTTLRAAMADAAWKAGQRLPGWADQARRFVEAAGAPPDQ